MTPQAQNLCGLIASAGFASGDRIVVGMWSDGPLGPMNDVMWARPDGTRVLLAPTGPIADFIAAVYRFDECHIVPVAVSVDQHRSRLTLDAGRLHMSLASGRAWFLPPAVLRPPWFTRYVEGPIARATMGVHTYGTTPNGVREWYRVDAVRRVHTGMASHDGIDLGALSPVRPGLAMGVSDPPSWPSIVRVRPRLYDPSGRLDAVLRTEA